MGNLLKWGKIALLIFFSLETIVVAFLGMYLAWLLTIPLGGLINGTATIVAGIVGFAGGSMIFLLLSTKFLEKEETAKRSC